MDAAVYLNFIKFLSYLPLAIVNGSMAIKATKLLLAVSS